MSNEISVTPQNDIVYASFRLHESGLEPIGEPDFDEWKACGDFINKSQKAVHFWIGDWLNYGERKWGERYKEALEKTKYDYQTLRNDKWVASKIPMERRNANLSFDHHSAVADFMPEEQEELLQKAIEQKLNNETFRKFVKGKQLMPTPDSSSRGRDKSQVIHSILNANDAFYRQIDQCDVTDLSDGEKLHLSEELQKTQKAIEQFLYQLQ